MTNNIMPKPQNNHLTIHGLIKSVTRIQEQLDIFQIPTIAAGENSADISPPAEHIFQHIVSLVNQAEAIFSSTHTTPADLPIRSRRAYQWLKFLTLTNNLSEHIETLKQVAEIRQKLRWTRKIPPHQFTFRLYHIGTISTFRMKNQTINWTIQEAFIGIPITSLESFLSSLYNRNSSQQSAALHQYTSSSQYRRIREEIEYLGIPEHRFAMGNAWDLQEIFHRVNQRFFDQKLSPPHLIWSSRDTYRKFGHYQYETDTVQMSTSLDRREVPRYVLEYVMFHELLHKKLGYQKKEHRRYSHTKAFREQEASFPKINQARRYLEQLAIDRSGK